MPVRVPRVGCRRPQGITLGACRDLAPPEAYFLHTPSRLQSGIGSNGVSGWRHYLTVRYRYNACHVRREAFGVKVGGEGCSMAEKRGSLCPASQRVGIIQEGKRSRSRKLLEVPG